MADKKAIIVVAASAELSSSGNGMGKLLKKGALIPSFTQGAVIGDAVAESDAVHLAPAAVAGAVENGIALMVVDLGNADSAALDAALVTILDAADRRTVIAVAAKNALGLYGVGIDPKVGTLARAAKAEDILPTLATLGEFPLTTQCSGAVIYQALKNPNPKLEELLKLKEALTRMEGALARDNREPWDKHDCA